jgi:hypothetical protein
MFAGYGTNCPECDAPAHDPLYSHFGLDVINITTQDDKDYGLVRYALRCQNPKCGYAGAFVAKPLSQLAVAMTWQPLPNKL